MLLQLLDVQGRHVNAEAIPRGRSVEMRCYNRQVGMADRDYLKKWLRNPDNIYAFDDCMWIPFHGTPSLGIDPLVPCRPLAQYEINGLLEEL